MCKINGHSIFSYHWTGWLTGRNRKLLNSKNDAKIALANAQQAQAEKAIEDFKKPASTEVEGDMPIPVVPVKTTGTGMNSNLNNDSTNQSSLRIGLNL